MLKERRIEKQSRISDVLEPLLSVLVQRGFQKQTNR
jgi:hypothetical protein